MPNDADGSAPSVPGSGAPSPPGTPSGGSQQVRSRRWAVAIIVIAVAALVVFAVLFTGVVVISPQHSVSSYEPQPFSAAESAADNLSGATPGGPWLLHGVQGSDVTVPFGIQAQFGSTCEYSSGTGYDSIEPYTGNYSNGQLGNWLFFYHNAKDTEFLVVADEGGRTSNIGVVSLSTCGPGTTIPPEIPHTVLDSPQVATALHSNILVERFIGSNPIANSSFLLVDLGAPWGWVWQVGYQTCQVGSYGPWTGNDVEARVNATTGSIENISSAAGVSSCTEHPITTPIGPVFGLFFPTEATCPAGDTYAGNGCRGGDAIYRAWVDYAQSPVDLGNLLLQVETSNGTVLTLSDGVGGFAVLNGSLDLVAESAASPTMSMTGWTFPPGSPATNATVLKNGFGYASEFEVDLGPSSPYGLGYVLVVSGTGPLSGTVSENLP